MQKGLWNGKQTSLVHPVPVEKSVCTICGLNEQNLSILQHHADIIFNFVARSKRTE